MAKLITYYPVLSRRTFDAPTQNSCLNFKSISLHFGSTSTEADILASTKLRLLDIQINYSIYHNANVYQ